MLIVKHGKSNKYDTIKFSDFIDTYEKFTGIKVNRRKLNYRLLNNDTIKINDTVYNKKINGGF